MHGLYIVTPDWDDTEKLITCTQKALLGGAQMVQYRHKTASDELRLEQAKALLKVCRFFKKPLIINDHINLCMEIDADGVHVGATDASITSARQQLGMEKIIGASCYGSLELAQKAADAQASYLAFGGFYPSKVKKYAVTTPPDIIAQAKQMFTQPIVVIGGMTADNCIPLLKQGADSVAAISSVYQARDVTASAQCISALFDQYSSLAKTDGQPI